MVARGRRRHVTETERYAVRDYLADLPDLRGQVTLVTGGGGASSAASPALTAAGAAVAVVSRTEELVAETVALLEREGGRAFGTTALRAGAGRAGGQRAELLEEAQVVPVRAQHLGDPPVFQT
jgi:shikimate 5-dehydrogenase